jgi:hypothetical protein
MRVCRQVSREAADDDDVEQRGDRERVDHTHRNEACIAAVRLAGG